MTIALPRRSATLLSVAVGVLIGAESGCSSEHIKVTREEPKVETQFYDKGVRTPESAYALHNECANTNWDFHCYSDFDFDVVDDKPIPIGRRVALRIKQVRLRLELPITMYLPEQASLRVRAHEEGHVKICRTAYDSAYAIARDAAQKVVGREFKGDGKTFEQACRIALSNASQEIGRHYRAGTVDKVNTISAMYDRITSTRNDPSYVDTAIEQATRQTEKLWANPGAAKNTSPGGSMNRSSAASNTISNSGTTSTSGTAENSEREP
ncbi:MAG TPA: hypothetical protein V6D17_14880 [Candidatus Obscuribacterales bacterium]